MQNLHLANELLCVLISANVILFVPAHGVMLTERRFHPIKKLWLALGHLGNEDLQDSLVRQDAPFKISILYFHTSLSI
jgi:hypothetical protein